MTLDEKIVVSAYTGYLMCDFNEIHRYVEKLLGRPVFTHELAHEAIQNEIRKKSKADFLKICADNGEFEIVDDDRKIAIEAWNRRYKEN